MQRGTQARARVRVYFFIRLTEHSKFALGATRYLFGELWLRSSCSFISKEDILKKLVGFISTFAVAMTISVPANASDFTNSSFLNGFTATLVSSTDIGGGTTRVVATWTHSTATLLTTGTPSAGQILNQGQRLLQCNSSSVTFSLNNIMAPAGCIALASTRSATLSGNTLTVTYDYLSAGVTRPYVIADTWWEDSGTDAGNGTSGNDLVVPTGSSSSSGGSDSDAVVSLPSSKTPTINEFVDGPLLVTPGTNVLLTGSRLSCTTSISVNDKPTTFTYQTLASGQGQLSIAMPKDLTAGKHRLSMDSCGGSVVYDNMLMVSKAPVKLELNMASGIDRGLGLVQLRAFVREHRADFNSVECVADASLSAQRRIATSLVESFCKRAMGLLASPKSHTTAIKSDNKADSILLTLTLSNK